MAKFYDKLDNKLKAFIEDQKIFFTATADQAGRINLSPKGMDTFRVLADNKVGFLSVTGSGNETAAHLMKDRRITIMFCSFTTDPLILRLYGTGRCIYRHHKDWEQTLKSFKTMAGMRQIFIIDIESIQTSCGFSIPYYEYKGNRDTLLRWADQRGSDGVKQYWHENNQRSIDGLDTGIGNTRAET